MNYTRWLKIENSFFIFVLVLINTLSAIAGPSLTTYQAKIIKPDGFPLEAASVNFRFTILDPIGTCILYSENYSSIDMSGTGGLVSFGLGSGIKTFPVSATTFENVFSNITPALSCDAGGPPIYNPASNDTRKIVMQFHDGNGWQTLPAMNINAVPYAMYASDAQKLGGVSATSFVQASMIPSCGVSEAVRYNGATFSCVAVGGSGGGSVTSGSVITALGYTPANGASITTLTSNLNSTNAEIASVSSTVFAVSSTVSSLSNSVSTLAAATAASFSTITSSQWATSGTTINYMAGNVGIGTSAPLLPLQVQVDQNSATLVQIRNTSSATAAMVALNLSSDFASANLAMTSSNYPASNASLPSQLQFYTSGSASGGIMLSARGASAPIIFANSGPNTERMRLSWNGNLGIGTATPTARLHLAAGNSSNASLKLTSGVLTTTPQSGTIEYDGSQLYFTDGTNTRHTIATGSGSLSNSADNTYSGVNTFTGQTYVSNNTTSTDSSTGALVVSGGVGIGGTLNVAGNTNIAGIITTSSQIRSTSSVSAPVIYAGAGSALSPSFTFSPDSATGMWQPTSGALALSTAGLEQVRVTSGGYVGIGTSTPTAVLTVDKDLGTAPLFYSGFSVSTTARSSGSNQFRPNIFNTTAVGANNFQNVSGLHNVITSNLTGSANVGMQGVSTDLYVNNNAAALYGYRIIPIIGSGTATTYAGFNARTPSVAGGASLTAAYGVHIESQQTTGVASAYAIYQTGASDTNYFAGNVGIGTTNPSGKLEVNGGNFIIANDSSLALGLVFKPSDPSAAYSNTVDERQFQWMTTGIGTGFGYKWSWRNNDGSPRKDVMTFVKDGAVGFSGNVGIGTTTPTAKLHLAAGTSQTSSLKLTSGTLTTSAQSGTMEYDGFNFYLTDSTNTRRTITTGSSAGAIDNASNINSTGNITMTPTGSVIVSSTTGSTNSQTGALIVKGGVGIAGDINASGTLNVTGSVTVGSNIFGNGNIHTGGGNRGFWMDSPGSYDYGIWRDPSNNVHLRSGGTTERLTISSSTGYVGIGTSAPTQMFENAGARTALGKDGADYHWFTTNTGVVEPNNIAFGIKASAGVVSDFRVTTSGTARFHVNSAGNVGIGTTTPNSLLVVSRSTTALGSQIEVASNSTSGYITAPLGGEGMILSSSRYNGSDWVSDSIGAAALTIYDGQIQMFTNSGLTPGASHSYVERVRVDNVGNFMIGTTIPGLGRLAVESSGTTYLSLNTTNGSHKRSGVIFRSFDLPQFEIGIDGSVNGTRDFYVYDSVSGTARMTINSVGNVGIGNSAPKTNLDIGASGASSIALGHEGSYMGFNSYFNGGWKYKGNGHASIIRQDATGIQIQSAENNVSGADAAMSPTVVMTLNSSGNVGVGTMTPTKALHVVGDLLVERSANTASLEANGANDTDLAALRLVRRRSDATAPAAGFGVSTHYILEGSVDNAEIFAGQTGVIWEQTQTNATTARDSAMYFATMSDNSRTEKLRITSAGNVGIGTPSPSRQLHLYGGLGDTKALIEGSDGNAASLTFKNTQGDVAVGIGSDEKFHIGSDGSNPSGSTWLTVDTSGNVGVGTTNPGYKLDVSGTINIASGSALAFGGTSVCTAAGCTSSSDERLKENIKPLDLNLEKLLSLNAVQYDWKDKSKYGDKHQIGFIAQELEKVYPDVVHTDKNNGLKSVSYDKLVAPIIEALKVFNKHIADLFDHSEKQQRQIASIEKENADLKARVEKTEKENADLKKRLDRIEKVLSK